MKSLFLGILLIIIIGVGGFVYRNAAEHPAERITCPVDVKYCPDGTAVGRTGMGCDFPACPAPNVSFASANLAFAVPEGFVQTSPLDDAVIAAYEKKTASTTSTIVIRRFAIASSSTALKTIEATAIGGASGMPVSPTRFYSTVLANHRFTVVDIERFEAVIDTAYYLARETDVLRFDAIDRDVLDWTDPKLDTSKLPANAALRQLLLTLQGE
jgi:hypothetical protein